MNVAYIDTSVLVAVAFGERSAAAMARRLNEFASLLSSNLLEAELRSVHAREERRFEANFLSPVEWVLPNRTLSREIAAVLDAGYVRGADLWHLATALYVAPEPSEIWFVTLDQRQRTTASALGFRT